MKFVLLIMTLNIGMFNPDDMVAIKFETKQLCKKAQAQIDNELIKTHCLQVKN